MPSRVRRRQRQRRSLPYHLVLVFVAIAFVVIAAVCAVSYWALGGWFNDMPDVTTIAAYNKPMTTKVYANDGTTLLGEFYLEDRDPVELNQISEYVKEGTVDTEDVRFYDHNGVDFQGIIRAIVVNLTAGSTEEGASTITQQLVRNTLLLDEMNDITIKRKVREAYLALQVEQEYSKDEILNMYLNTVNYGDGAYGIQKAALHYFSKNASELTLAESALLVGIPQSPTANNPKNYPEKALTRRNLVLQRMLSNGDITQQEYDEAVAEPITLNPSKDTSNDGLYKYPYFTSWVRKLLLEDYSTDEVYSGGMTVYTTLDPRLQEAAEQAARDKLSGMDDDVEVSLTSIDPDTGYVVALVGGKDYYTDQFNLATQAARQAGSCFKMFTLVASIEAGIDPQTTVDCSSPVYFGDWRVENYGGATYSARSIQGATQISSNTAYARLVELVGADKVVDVAHRMGITNDLEPVPSITLGSQGVNTLQMASAYGTLATGGVYHAPKFITKIVNQKGETIYDATTDLQGEQAISPEVAHATVEVLKTVVTGGTATRAKLSSQVSAGKTGTSQNYRDSMYCGITPQLSTAVWIGSRQERAIADNMGGSNCCPVWKQYMEAALEGMPAEEFPEAADPAYNSEAAKGLNTSGEKGEGADNATTDNRSNSNSSSSSSSSSRSSSGTSTGGSTSGTTGEGGGGTSGGNTGGGETPSEPVNPEPGGGGESGGGGGGETSAEPSGDG